MNTDWCYTGFLGYLVSMDNLTKTSQSIVSSCHYIWLFHFFYIIIFLISVQKSIFYRLNLCNHCFAAIANGIILLTSFLTKYSLLFIILFILEKSLHRLNEIHAYLTPFYTSNSAYVPFPTSCLLFHSSLITHRVQLVLFICACVCSHPPKHRKFTNKSIFKIK